MIGDSCNCETIGNLREIISEQDEQIARMREYEMKRRSEQIDRAADALLNALKMLPSRIEFKVFTAEREFGSVEWARPDIRLADCTVGYQAPEDVALAIREALIRYTHRATP